MAKASKVVASDGIDKVLLAAIVAATAKAPDGFEYVSQVQGQPMLSHNPPLIIINLAMVDPNDGTRVAARATDAAAAYLAANAAPVVHTAPTHNYAIITNAVLPPPKKRGNTAGSGAPTKYPFAELQIGGSFFSSDSEHAKGDAVKALGSTVSSQNRKYATPDPSGATKKIKQAVRGPDKKPVLDANGKKQVEEKTIPVLHYERKFTIRPVVAGHTYGAWIAPANGALIARTV